MPRQAQARRNQREIKIFPLSALFRIRNSVDYAEEKTMPKKAEVEPRACIFA